MLIEFRVANHRSIREEQVLSFEAAPLGAKQDSRPRSQGSHGQRLLPAMAIYGANASGKSNILDAFAFMKRTVIFSQRLWEPDSGVPRAPFAWGGGANSPSLFEVTFTISGVRHQYGFVLDEDRILEEWLYVWPRGRKQTWFEREEDDFHFGEHLRGENRTIEQLTRSNALFLSAAVQHGHLQLDSIYRWFSDITLVNLSRGSSRSLQRVSRRRRVTDAWENGDNETLNALRDLLRAADMGITDIKVVSEAPLSDDDSISLRPGRRTRVWLKHRSSDKNAWLPLDEESHGTRTLFDMAVPIFNAIARGSILVADELEASLHPLLASHIVRQFNDPALNPRNGQLLFATHDTNLLGPTIGEPLLRRDQIWLTEKDDEGATCLYPLTDYKPRKAENLERGYLQGRYGAIPFLGDFRRLIED